MTKIFHEDPIISFYAKLITNRSKNRQTNRQTRAKTSPPRRSESSHHCTASY